MKSPSEIKKGLRHCSEDGCKGCNYKSDCDMVDGFSVLAYDALAYIQQLDDHIRDLTKMMPKWISVEERLPKICELVLVIASGKPKENVKLIDAVIIASYWGDEGWIADAFDGWGKLNVTHWMPLPDPPKEDE